jgi:hypothetical protein
MSNCVDMLVEADMFLKLLLSGRCQAEANINRNSKKEMEVDRTYT